MKCPYLCLGCLALTFAACKQDREIKVYRVARESEPAQQAAPSADPHAGMPGMTPGGAMPGDPHAGLSPDQMAAGAPTGPAPFTDTPPAHWKKQALSPMRLASYLVQGEGGATVDISFTILRRAPGGTLANVNRWRDQLGQPALDDAALKQASQSIKTFCGEGIAVEIEGTAPNSADAAKDGRIIGVIADQGDNSLFFKMRGNSALTAAEKEAFLQWVATVKPADPAAPAATPAVPSSPSESPAMPPPAANDGSLTWQIPDGWTLAPAAGSMRYATITMAAADGAKGELVVSHFPGDVGGDLENVNRWRQQAAIEPVDQAGLAPLITKVTVGPESFSLIDVTGPKIRLIAGWTRHGPDTWFFKFTGPDALVGAEKARFTAFLESVRFTKPE